MLTHRGSEGWHSSMFIQSPQFNSRDTNGIRPSTWIPNETDEENGVPRAPNESWQLYLEFFEIDRNASDHPNDEFGLFCNGLIQEPQPVPILS